MATAVVMAVTAVPVLMSGEAFAETSPVSGSFAMGGGSMGEVDPRKGVFRTSLPLLALQGQGGLDVSVSLTYDQQSAAAEQNKGAGRAGLGAGWSYSLPAVAVEGGVRVIPASGGSYEADAGEVTGMARYPLEDLKFEEKQGTLPARDGIEGERAYSYLLRYDDGRTDYFDANGDLSVRTDRFGNRIDFGWEVPPDGQTHRLAWAVDSYGQKTVLESAPDGSVTVISPKRSDGKAPEMKLALTEGQLTSITDTAGQRTTFHYENPDQPALLTRAGSPTGAQTVVAYKPVDYMPGLTVVDSVKVTDDNGENTLSERRFSMDVEGGDRRNYTGFPAYHDRGGNALFDADDNDAENYTYITELSDGRSTVRSTYNKLHLLTKRETKLKAGQSSQDSSGGVTVQTQELHYEGEKDGTPPRPDNLPANYSKPTEATVTFTDPATGAKRTTRETAKFDTHGRQTEKTDVTGATTTTVYDDKRYGLPVKTIVNGTDGAMAVTENTLSGDGKTVAESKTLVGKKGQALTARTVTSAEYDGHGEVTSTTTGWAEGARPEGDKGPEKSTETREVRIDTAGHTRTETVTTPAGTTVEVTDLATGDTVESTDAAGRKVTTKYDEAGRAEKQTSPDGLVTETAYTPLSKTVTAPDGHVTVETSDLLGRPVKTTDNIRNGEIVPGEPAARTLQTIAYEDDGLTAKVTDGAGRLTVTTKDALGRPVKTVAPNGMTQITAYQDAATPGTSTKTTATLPAGETDPAKAVATSTETYDSAGRSTAATQSYADKTPAAPVSQSFDGLGRVAKEVSGEVAVTPSYDGPGGTVQKTTITPENPDAFPGTEITSDTKDDLTGATVVKTLTPSGGEGRIGTAVARDDAGRVISETDQNGKKTAYSYTPGGQIKESVSPTGVKTVFEYEDKTGRTSQVAVTSADGKTTQKTAYTYHPETGRITEVYNPDDKAGSLISYTYNADNKVLKVAYPDGKSLSQTFDNHGQRTSLTDTAGATTLYTYNGDGTPKTAVQYDKDPAGHKDARELARVTYEYDGLGRTAKIIRGGGEDNGVTTAYTYAGLKQIKTEKTTRADGTVITEAGYTYDSHGNLTERTDTRPDTAADGAPGSQAQTTTRYQYDAFDRLIRSDVTGKDNSPLTTTHYTVNVSGDVTKSETTDHTQDGKKTTTAYDIDAAGRRTAVTTDGTRAEQAWDDEGNLLRDHRGNTYTYDALNRPLTVTTPGGQKTSYTYWADGTRATASTGNDSGEGSAATQFHYTPDGTIANDTHTSGTDAGAATTASYLLAATREARTLTGTGAAQASATGSGYLLHDRHGNTTALTTADGTPNAAWNYTDYGQPADHTGRARPGTAVQGPAGPARNPFAYAGEYTNPETGTQYLRARTYDPTQTSFTSRDTANLHNLFQAFDANPITNVDPTGNTAETDNIISGLLIGFGILTAILTIAFFPLGGGAGAILASVGALAIEAMGIASESYAMATGNNQHDFDKPLQAFLTVTTIVGAVAGIGGVVNGARMAYKGGKTVASALAAEAKAKWHGVRTPPAAPPAAPAAIRPAGPPIDNAYIARATEKILGPGEVRVTHNYHTARGYRTNPTFSEIRVAPIKKTIDATDIEKMRARVRNEPSHNWIRTEGPQNADQFTPDSFRPRRPNINNHEIAQLDRALADARLEKLIEAKKRELTSNVRVQKYYNHK